MNLQNPFLFFFFSVLHTFRSHSERFCFFVMMFCTRFQCEKNIIHLFDDVRNTEIHFYASLKPIFDLLSHALQCQWLKTNAPFAIFQLFFLHPTLLFIFCFMTYNSIVKWIRWNATFQRHSSGAEQNKTNSANLIWTTISKLFSLFVCAIF